MVFHKLIKIEEQITELFYAVLHNRENILLTYLNQHCFNIYNTNFEYKALIDDEFTVFFDGFGIYAALRLFGFKDSEKFNATDLYEKIFSYFTENNTRLFLIGGRFSNLFIEEKSEEKKLNVCGYQDGYFNDDEFVNLIEKINQNHPEVIVIGMGAPKQEFLASKISDSIKNVPILCVGNFLEFYFGTKKRAPLFLRKIGMEWLHRMVMEPGRLWKRYLIGIPLFLFHILKLKYSHSKTENIN